MTVGNLALLVLTGVLAGTGIYLILDRGLVRIIVGTVLLANGINILIIVAGGAAGRDPFLNLTGSGPMADPLPQAMVLTAIVITLGTTSFLLALAYRAWHIARGDRLRDDSEDRRIRERAERGDTGEADRGTDSTMGDVQ
ncbi:Na(+)/H(+) antiporter subunit C [Spiractinospora alimapuensis]|uniref:Na(+)/H(+) antiporter subunit C n=1 Tax=Spiractinospora alimapuensis TaxID=2820884 RepID=UPI001F3AFF0E|nr:Na(+)/H(+) antiporter subunit C [Spiractinospora alimapuensis]QVQ53542.1 Na(+)/H(+) antiporter subunit C [Spiractinospora alimapuensis]